ncbi:hypothetical protein KHA80_22480 [Anaerobacillus sp. HL2]|nr:hypothetical protein KHA80_22480 [Anaerobacillus sp. HL2]
MAKNQIGIPVTVKDLSQMLRGEAGAAIVPYIVKNTTRERKRSIKNSSFH